MCFGGKHSVRKQLFQIGLRRYLAFKPIDACAEIVRIGIEDCVRMQDAASPDYDVGTDAENFCAIGGPSQKYGVDAIAKCAQLDRQIGDLSEQCPRFGKALLDARLRRALVELAFLPLRFIAG